MNHIPKPTAVLHLGENWLALDANRIQVMAAAPKLAGPVSVIETFGDSPSGVMRLQGKTAHAAALIERKVRAEGLVDGESRVLIHQQRTVSGAMEVLFTAVPLPIWQSVSGWAAAQRDHCSLLPLAAVASAGVKPGHGRVVRYGATLVYFADTSAGYVYAAVTAYSDAEEDVEIAVRALAEQAAIPHQGESEEATTRSATGAANRLQVTWCALYAEAQEDQRMQQLFAGIADCRLTDCGQGGLAQLDAGGHAIAGSPLKTATPFLLQRASIRQSVNTGGQRLAALAESSMPVSTAIAAVCAIGLFAFGSYHHTAAALLNTNTEKQNAQSAKQEQAASSMASKRTPAEYEAIQGFVNTLQGSVTGYNPSVVLNDIRVAAGTDIRVLRVRLENIPTKPLSILLDGALRSGIDASAVTAFLLQLRRAGYVVTPLDPADGGQSSNFTYRMVRGAGGKESNTTAAASTSVDSKGAL